MSNAVAMVRHDLEVMKREFAKVLPSHVTPDKIVRSVCNALQDNPYLLLCDKQSILKSAMTAAVLGLEVDNAVGQGYIVPFQGKAQFIPGYKGYITLAFNSGFIVSCEVVRERDEFSYKLGLNPQLDHTPGAGDVEYRGPITYAYATARHRGLPDVFKVLDIKQIHKKRDSSSGYKAFLSGKVKKSPWESDYEAMCAKTAVRALAPLLPLNVQRAAALEGIHDDGKHSYIDSDGTVRGTQQEQVTYTAEQPQLVVDMEQSNGS